MRSHQAKVLHHLAGKPLLTHVLHTSQGLRPSRLVVVVGHQAAAVQAVVQAACGGEGVRFALQQEQRGTETRYARARSSLQAFRGIF